MKSCQASGCSEAASGFSTYCDHHKQSLRRHGDPAQAGVTVHELRPYVAGVAARHAKNKDSDAWTILAKRWVLLADHARAVLARYAAGEPSQRFEVKAAQQVVNLADTVPADAVVHMAIAMYLFRDDQPGRFRSDKAFDYQLVRRVRGLSDVNAGTYWDQKAGRNKRVYRDLPPRAVEALAVWLKDAFGLAGLMLARKQRGEAAQVVEERHRLAAALEGLA